MVLGFLCTMVCVARMWTTSLMPMPNASAPSAPLVQVWLSPQITVVPGSVSPSSGPITCRIPWPSWSMSKRRMPALAVSMRMVSMTLIDHGNAPPVRPGADEITWSGVAKVRSGLRTGRPRSCSVGKPRLMHNSCR